MRNMKRFNNQRGFSLLEALFAMVVLSIAMLAIARMHALVTQDGGYSKARAIAVNLAQEKLDDLRSFTSINTGCGAGVFCFTEIGDNTGGREDGSGNLVFPSGNITIGNTTYNRTWTVTNWYICGNAAPSNTNCVSPFTKLYPDFKTVVVLVAWTDEQNNSRSVTLRANYHSSPLTAETNSLAAPYPGPGPDITAIPTGENPIEIGGGKITETSKPLPEVSGIGSRRVTLPSIVYTGEAGSELLVSQEEFVTVNCTCTLQASGTGWTPYRTVWNGNKLVQEYGVQLTKRSGQPSDLSMAGTTNQDELCFECCRDHHDTNADADGVTDGTQYYPAYRPYIPVTQFDATTGDHKHYKADGTEAAVGEVYVEACRFKRIDGFWRVVQDWMLVDLSVYGCDYFAETATYQCPVTGSLSTTKQDTYKTWVKDVLKNFVRYMNDNRTVNTATTTLPEYSSAGGNVVNPLLDTSNSAHDIYVNQGGNRQLIARGLYADVIFKRKGSGDARSLDTDYIDAVLPVNTSSNFSLLQYIPFYDANMTLLARWSPTSTDTAGAADYGDCSPTSPTYDIGSGHAVCVTSEAIDTVNDPSLNYYNDYYSRGKIYGKLAGNNLVAAHIARGNNGLTSSASINGATDTVLFRSVKAVVPSGTAAISGRVWRGNSGATLNYVTITASPASGVTCAFTSPATLATASAADYSCTVPGGWVGTLTFGDSAPSVTYAYSPAATTVTITAPGTVPDVFVYGETSSIRGRITTIDVVGAGYGDRPDIVNTTVSYTGTVGGVATAGSSGTCVKYNQIISNPGARTTQWYYACTVPVGWTGTVTVDVDETGLASGTSGHLYWSPNYAEATAPYCTGVSGSCTLQTIPAVLGDVDGISGSPDLATRAKTNVQAGR